METVSGDLQGGTSTAAGKECRRKVHQRVGRRNPCLYLGPGASHLMLEVREMNEKVFISQPVDVSTSQHGTVTRCRECLYISVCENLNIWIWECILVSTCEYLNVDTSTCECLNISTCEHLNILTCECQSVNVSVAIMHSCFNISRCKCHNRPICDVSTCEPMYVSTSQHENVLPSQYMIANLTAHECHGTTAPNS